MFTFCAGNQNLATEGGEPPTFRNYSVITWSAHSISDTNIVGLPNFAP